MSTSSRPQPDYNRITGQVRILIAARTGSPAESSIVCQTSPWLCNWKCRFHFADRQEYMSRRAITNEHSMQFTVCAAAACARSMHYKCATPRIVTVMIKYCCKHYETFYVPIFARKKYLFDEFQKGSSVSFRLGVELSLRILLAVLRHILTSQAFSGYYAYFDNINPLTMKTTVLSQMREDDIDGQRTRVCKFNLMAHILYATKLCLEIHDDQSSSPHHHHHHQRINCAKEV